MNGRMWMVDSGAASKSLDMVSYVERCPKGGLTKGWIE